MRYAGGMKQDQIVQRVRAVVERQPLPDFMTGFDVRLGEFDGDPALWVIFKLIPGPDQMSPEIKRRVRAMAVLEEALLPGLLEAFEDGAVYFHYERDRSRIAVAE